MALTILQHTNLDGFPKAGELIEITGAYELEAADRALSNALFKHAHESGKLATPGATWEVSLAALRLSSHESNDRLRESLSRLLSVQVKVSYRDGKLAREMVLQTHLFDAFITPKDGGPGGGFVRFGIPDVLRAVLAQSGRWGRIKAEVICALSSKYAITLYELVQLRANMDRCVETFPIARFRDLMGVPPGKLLRGPDFTRFVIDPAVLEVNGISDMGIKAALERRSRFAPINAVTIAWWRKEGDELRGALLERNRSKVGRMARLRGQAETITPLLQLPPGDAAYDSDRLFLDTDARD
jgi:Initiator Replication protein